jgi:hypothetical protein
MKVNTQTLLTLKKGVSFPGSIFRVITPLSDHVQEVTDLPFAPISEAISAFLCELKQFDAIEMPDGTTFTRTFTPGGTK